MLRLARFLSAPKYSPRILQRPVEFLQRRTRFNDRGFVRRVSQLLRADNYAFPLDHPCESNRARSQTSNARAGLFDVARPRRCTAQRPAARVDELRFASLRRPSSDRDRDGRRVSVFSFASKERAPRSKQPVTAMRHGRGTETVGDSHGNATNWRSASSSFSINLFRLERAYSPSLDSLPRPGTRYRLPRYSPARSKPTKRIRAPRADTVTRKGKDRDPRAVRLAT